MRNAGALKDRINAVAQAAEDRAFAEDIRVSHPHAVQEHDDDALTKMVTMTRQQAIALGITDPRLRARFVMIACALAPDFWRNPLFYHLLNAKTGSADLRFGDVCAVLRLSLEQAGHADMAWW
ncbi:MAG: hypothetical protein ACRCS3_05825 [Paracoccaceae bacterium]